MMMNPKFNKRLYNKRNLLFNSKFKQSQLRLNQRLSSKPELMIKVVISKVLLHQSPELEVAEVVSEEIVALKEAAEAVTEAVEVKVKPEAEVDIAVPEVAVAREEKAKKVNLELKVKKYLPEVEVDIVAPEVAVGREEKENSNLELKVKKAHPEVEVFIVEEVEVEVDLKVKKVKLLKVMKVLSMLKEKIELITLVEMNISKEIELKNITHTIENQAPAEVEKLPKVDTEKETGEPIPMKLSTKMMPLKVLPLLKLKVKKPKLKKVRNSLR